MLFEKYKGKKVKILIASNSGAGVSTGATSRGYALSSIIVAGGILNDYDEDFIEITNVQMIRLNLSDEMTFGINKIEPRHEDFNSTMINKKSVISISLIEE